VQLLCLQQQEATTQYVAEYTGPSMAAPFCTSAMSVAVVPVSRRRCISKRMGAPTCSILLPSNMCERHLHVKGHDLVFSVPSEIECTLSILAVQRDARSVEIFDSITSIRALSMVESLFNHKFREVEASNCPCRPLDRACSLPFLARRSARDAVEPVESVMPL
jgi:hypothetical protein